MATALTAPFLVSHGEVARPQTGASVLDRVFKAIAHARMVQVRREISYHLGTLPQDQLNKTGYRITDRT